jgi:hypothetical protein
MACKIPGDGSDPKTNLTTESTESTEGKDVRAVRSLANSVTRMKFP